MRVLKAVTHIHTSHSWDSRLSPKRLVRSLTAAGVDLALITDHNSFAGSIEAQAYISTHRLELQVPTAAEIRTDLGDVVVIVDGSEPPPIRSLLNWEDLQNTVRACGGLIWLPHPYRSHSDEAAEEIGASADLIEVFNSRCTEGQNWRAQDLCARHGKVPTLGMDAHFNREATRWSVEYEPRGSLFKTVGGAPHVAAPMYSNRHDVHAAEMIYSFKEIRRFISERRLDGVSRHLLRSVYHLARVGQTWVGETLLRPR